MSSNINKSTIPAYTPSKPIPVPQKKATPTEAQPANQDEYDGTVPPHVYVEQQRAKRIEAGLETGSPPGTKKLDTNA